MSSTVLHEDVTVTDKAGNVSSPEPEPEEARDSELAKVEVAVQVSG